MAANPIERWGALAFMVHVALMPVAVSLVFVATLAASLRDRMRAARTPGCSSVEISM